MCQVDCEQRSCLSAVKIYQRDDSYRTFACTSATSYGTLLGQVLERLDLLAEKNLYALEIWRGKSRVCVPCESGLVRLQEDERLYLVKKSITDKPSLKASKRNDSSDHIPDHVQVSIPLQISYPLNAASNVKQKINKTLTESFAKAWSTGQSEVPQQQNEPRSISQQSKGKYRKRPRITSQLRFLENVTRTSNEVTVNKHLSSALPSTTLNQSWPLQRSMSEAVLCHSTPKESAFDLDTSQEKLDGLDNLELSLSTSPRGVSSFVQSHFNGSANTSVLETADCPQQCQQLNIGSANTSVLETADCPQQCQQLNIGSANTSVLETADCPQQCQQLNISRLPVNGSDLSSVGSCDITHPRTPLFQVDIPVNGSDLSSVGSCDITHPRTPLFQVDIHAKGKPFEHDISQFLVDSSYDEYTSEQNASLEDKELQSQMTAWTPPEDVLLPPRVPPRTSSSVTRDYLASDQQLLQEGRKLQFVMYKRAGAKRSKKSSLQSAIQQLFGRKSTPTAPAGVQMRRSKQSRIMPVISRSQTSSALVSAAVPMHNTTHNWITSGRSLHSSSPNLCGKVDPSRLSNSLGINSFDEEIMTPDHIDHLKFHISSSESINDEDLSSIGTTSQSSSSTHNKNHILLSSSFGSTKILSKDFSSESAVGLDKCNSTTFVLSKSFSSLRNATPVTRRAEIHDDIHLNTMELNSECFPHSTVSTAEFSALHSTSLWLKSCSDSEED